MILVINKKKKKRRDFGPLIYVLNFNFDSQTIDYFNLIFNVFKSTTPFVLTLLFFLNGSFSKIIF